MRRKEKRSKRNEVRRLPARHRLNVLRALCLLAALTLILTAVGCKKGSDVPLSPGLKMIEGEPVYDSGVAMQTDHFTVTPGMMAYFFYDYGGRLMASMEAQKPFEEGKSLHDQLFTDTLSWYDVIMNETLAKVSEMLIYCEAASANGVALSNDQLNAIEGEISSLALSAATYYGKSADEYLQALYGPLMNCDELRGVLKLELLATTYSATVTRDLETGITEQAIRDYAEAKGLEDQTPSRNIAYLAVPYVSGEPDSAKVSRILNALRADPTIATLEGFPEVGTANKEQNLTPDNTGAESIEKWLFAAERTVGDCDRIEVGNYTYVLLYTGNGMSYAHVSARMSLFDIAFENWRNGWVDALTFGYNYDVIDSYDIT